MNTKNMFESLFENANQPSLICKREGEILRVNELAKKCLLHDKQELQSVFQLISSWNPDVQTDSIFIPPPKACEEEHTAALMKLRQFSFRADDDELIWIYFEPLENNEIKNSLVASWHPVEGYHGLMANDGTMLHVSQEVLELCQKPLSEVVGLKFWEAPWFKSENNFRQVVRRACLQTANDEFVRFELHVSIVDDEKHIHHFCLRPLNEHSVVSTTAVDENTAYPNTFKNHVSSKQLLSIIEATKDLMASIDSSGRLFFLNQAGRSMLQIAPDENITQYKIEDLHSTATSKTLREVALESASRCGYWTGETTWKRKDGSEFTTLQSIIAHHDEYNNILHFSILAKDISHQKNIEKLLQTEKHFSESLLNNMHDGYSLINPQGEVLEVNDALCAMIGYSKEEIVGQKIPLKHWPDDMKEELRGIYLSLKNKRNEPFEAVFKHKNGQLISVLISPTIIRNGDGQITYHFNTIKNISEYKNIVQQLTDTQTFIQAILRNTPSQIYVLNLSSGEMTFTNHGSSRMLGYTEEDFSSMGPSYFMQLLHPDDVNGLSEFFSYMRTVDDNVVVEREYRMRHKNGEYRYFYSYNSIFKRNENNEAIEIGGSAVDITEHRKTEIAIRKERQLFNSLIERSHDIFVITTPERLRYVSSNVEDILGYTTKEFEEIPLDVLLHPEDFPPKWDQLNQPGSSLTIEYRARHKNGEWRWIEAYGVNLLHMESIQGLVFNLHDITERKNHELMLGHLATQLKSKNEQLEQFTNVASHDLQEPLRTMISCVDVLLLDFAPKLDEDAKQFLGFIKQSSERMSALISGLLNFGRLGKEEDTTAVDTKALIGVILSDLHNSISNAHAEIEVGDLPVLEAHYDEMRMLFQNLISNAIKFSKKDVPIHISINAEKKRNQWLFCVSDNGIGIESKYMESIFVIFKRLNSRCDYDGTGIGLSICKKIVELHGGEIWVESVPGEGSKFYFTIPE
jgi:PAS domain S-box-containing protein